MSGYLRRLAERAVLRGDGAPQPAAVTDPFENTVYDSAWPAASAVTPPAAAPQPVGADLALEAPVANPQPRIAPAAPIAGVAPPELRLQPIQPSSQASEMTSAPPVPAAPGEPAVVAHHEHPPAPEFPESPEPRVASPAPRVEPPSLSAPMEVRTSAERQAAAAQRAEFHTVQELASVVEHHSEVLQRVEPASEPRPAIRPAPEPETSLVIHRMQVDVIASRPETSGPGRRSGRPIPTPPSMRGARSRAGAPPAAFGLRQM